jgi:hypothetical protein
MNITPRSKKSLCWVAGVAILILVGIVVANLTLNSGGDSATGGVEGDVWTCSMHPQVRLPKPGKCPICSMPLIPAKTAGNTATSKEAGGRFDAGPLRACACHG